MSDIDITSETERFRIGLMLDCYGSLLTEKQKKNMELYFQDDLSLSEISELQGVSRQAIRDSLQTGIKALTTFEEKLGLVEKTEKLDKITNEIEKLTRAHSVPEEIKEILKSLI